MINDINKLKNSCEELMNRSIQHLEQELVKIRAGKASPNMLEGILVESYGNNVPIQQVSNVTVSDARTLIIQPWEKSTLAVIERAILASNIGVTPQNDGTIIRINLPPLTEERRKELVKISLLEAEQSKISIRNIRRDNIEEIKKMQKNGLSEDETKNLEKDIQVITDKHITLIDAITKNKEKEILTV